MASAFLLPFFTSTNIFFPTEILISDQCFRVANSSC